VLCHSRSGGAEALPSRHRRRARRVVTAARHIRRSRRAREPPLRRGIVAIRRVPISPQRSTSQSDRGGVEVVGFGALPLWLRRKRVVVAIHGVPSHPRGRERGAFAPSEARPRAAAAPRHCRHARSAILAERSTSQGGSWGKSSLGSVLCHSRCGEAEALSSRHPKVCSARGDAGAAHSRSQASPPSPRRARPMLAPISHQTGSNAQPRRRTRPSSSSSSRACWSAGTGKALLSSRTSEFQLPRRPII
jgi:hypothetical protein